MTAPSQWPAPEGVDLARFEELAERYRGDPELRARLESGDAAGEVGRAGPRPCRPASKPGSS